MKTSQVTIETLQREPPSRDQRLASVRTHALAMIEHMQALASDDILERYAAWNEQIGLVQSVVHFIECSTSEEEDLIVEENGEQYAISLDSDSLLNQAARNLNATMLAWHYRSRHEALIGFSNAAFYDGRWSKLTPGERSLAIWKFADLLDANKEKFAKIESENTGKPSVAALTAARARPAC